MNPIFETFTSRATADAWIAGMLPVLIKSALILGAAGIVNRFLQNSAAALRHLVWLAAIGGVLFLPVITNVVPSIGVPVDVVSSALNAERTNPRPEAQGRFAAPEGTSSGRAATTPGERVPSARHEAGTGVVADRQIATVREQPRGISAVLANLGRVHWTVWLFVVWIAGTFVLLSRLALSHLSALSLLRSSTLVHDDDWHLRLERHAERLAVNRRVRLRETDWLDVPVTVGSIRPAIILPSEAADWDDATRDAVLLHELAHVRRLDCLSQTLVECVRAFLWVNPLAWMAEKEMRVERERACDDLVITHGTRASSYAQTLLDLAGSLRGRDRASAAVMAMARRSDLEGRLLDILDNGPRLRNVNRVGTALALVVVMSIVLPVAALSPKPQADDSLPSADFVSDELGGELAATLKAELSDALEARFASGLSKDIELAVNESLAGALREASSDASPLIEQIMRDVERAVADHEFGLSDIEFDASSLPGRWSTTSSDTLTIEQIIELARHGVDADYIEELRSSGYEDLSFETLLSFARQGVDADYVAELSDYGYANLPAEDLIMFARHGIDADLIASLRASGLEDLSPDEIVGLARHGVDGDDIAGFAAAGLRGLTSETLIELARHGVDPQDVETLARLGYDDLEPEDYVEFARYGIDEDLLGSLDAAGMTGLSLESVVELARHGVDGDMIQGIHSLGYSDVTVDEIVDLARYGVDPDCVEELNSAGYGRFTIEQVIQLSRYGVDADYIGELEEAGIKDLSVDELVKLRKHGVSADYIKKARNDW